MYKKGSEYLARWEHPPTDLMPRMGKLHRSGRECRRFLKMVLNEIATNNKISEAQFKKVSVVKLIFVT